MSNGSATTSSLVMPGDGFAHSLHHLLPADSVRRAETVMAINRLECLLREQASNFHQFVSACKAIRDTSGRPSQEVAKGIARAAKNHFSESWFYRSVKAAGLSMEYPALQDIADRERLTILARVPPDMRDEVFSSGRIGTADVRTSGRAELRNAVRSLRHDAQAGFNASDAISAKLARRIAKISAIVPEDSKFAAVKQALAQAAQLLSQGQSA